MTFVTCFVSPTWINYATIVFDTRVERANFKTNHELLWVFNQVDKHEFKQHDRAQNANVTSQFPNFQRISWQLINDVFVCKKPSIKWFHTRAIWSEATGCAGKGGAVYTRHAGYCTRCLAKRRKNLFTKCRNGKYRNRNWCGRHNCFSYRFLDQTIRCSTAT